MSRHADRPVSTPPKSVPLAAVLGILVALLLIALGVVGLREVAVDQGWTSGQSWFVSLAQSLDGLQASTAVTVPAVIAGLVGLFLLYAALAPAGRTHTAARGDADVWFTPDAVANLARSAADRAPGVVAADVTRSSRKRVGLGILTQRGSGEALASAREAADAAVAPLAGVKVSVQQDKEI